ncbi:hypothetical protein EV122DRAFT_295654 [Schizophyllum commune]
MDDTAFLHMDVPLVLGTADRFMSTPLDLRPIPAAQDRSSSIVQSGNDLLARLDRRASYASDSDIEYDTRENPSVQAAPVRLRHSDPASIPRPQPASNPTSALSRVRVDGTAVTGTESTTLRAPAMPSPSRATDSQRVSEAATANLRPDIPTQLGVAEGLVARPRGQAGRPNRGGYTLKTSLGWPENVHRYVKDWVHKEVDASLTCLKRFADQKEEMKAICRKVKDDANLVFLEQYADLWPVIELARARYSYNKKTIKKRLGRKALRRERNESLR